MTITVFEPAYRVTVSEDAQNITVQQVVNQISITDATVIPGPAGPKGEAGPQNLFIQPDQPVYSGAYIWFKTNMPGGGIDILVEDGL